MSNGHTTDLLEIAENGGEAFLAARLERFEESFGLSAEGSLSERLQRLEDNILGWDLLSGEGDLDLSRDALRRITKRARMFYLANPWIKRGVELQMMYIFGQGVSVQAADEAVNAVVQDCWTHPKNQAELTTVQALTGQEARLKLDGNLFFALFTNRMTGRVLVRTIPFAEIDDVICDPQDRATPWYYKRVWQEAVDPLNPHGNTRTMTAYYPDWRFDPPDRPDSIGGKPVIWDTPLYHVKVGGLPDMKFGVSEVYAALDWARAYQDSLSDDATRSRALARFVWRLVVPGGQQRVNAAKSKLGTTLNADSATDETNPPPARGSAAIVPKGQDFEPIRIAGATLQPDHSRGLRLATATALGLVETFFGDANVGNHATAKTLDRPTELMYALRQELWTTVLTNILRYAVEQSVMAPLGRLSGRLMRDPFDPDDVQIEITDVESDEIDVDFPSILEADMAGYVNAIVAAATLNGHPQAGTFDEGTLRRMLLIALRENDVDAVMEEIAAALAKQGAELPEPEGLRAAVRELTEAVRT